MINIGPDGIVLDAHRRKIIIPNCSYCGRFIGYAIGKHNDRIERYGSKIYHVDCFNKKEEDKLNYKNGIAKYKSSNLNIHNIFL